METTVKKFIEILGNYSADAVIKNQENEDFVHVSNLSNGDVIISTKKPIGYCKRTGSYAFITEVEDYLAVVPEIDENVDLFEIDLPIAKDEENINKFAEPIKHESKYKEAFYLLLKEMENSVNQKTLDKLHKLDIDL